MPMYILLTKRLIILISFIALLSSCKKIFDLPQEKNFISPNLNFSNKEFEPIIGRTELMTNLNSDNSTLPLKFEVVNARFGDGKPMTDLFQVQPVYVWKVLYTGLETSLEEIEAKRKIENHPMFEIRSSGQFIFWGSSSNALILPRPTDSSHLSQDSRFFDLKVSNTGGSVLIKDFELRYWRERPYEPSNDMNYYTGGFAPDPAHPYNVMLQDYIRPYLNNVIGKTTNTNLQSNDQQKDVVIYIRRFTGGNGHNLRIKMLDKDSVPIDPAMFNETKWDKMIHGFNRKTTTEYVQYDVAYPIPLNEVATPYSNGSMATTRIEYSRLDFGGVRTFASFGTDFAIYPPGDWEIVFHFLTQNPKFENE